MRHEPNRREFLTTGAAAVAAGPTLFAAAGRSAAAEAKWQMKLSTSSIHYIHQSVEEACQYIAKLGFTGLDLWSAHAGCPHLDEAQNKLGPDGLKKILEKTKLELFAFSVYSGGFAKYADLLGKMGGGVAVQGSGKASDPKDLTASTRNLMERLKPLVELAEKTNSYLAIENHGGSMLNSLDSFKAFVDQNKSPRLGIALAPYHLQGIKASVVEAIKICGKQLFFFYAWQRAGGEQQLPGVGPTDFTPWIAALAEVEYGGYVNAFMHGHPEPEKMSELLAKSKAYLETCYAKACP